MREKEKSAIGRLLSQISWNFDGGIRNFRDGGLGRENVLTTEVFQALDFLPRNAFLGAIIEASQGADQARRSLRREIEGARLSVLPGNSELVPSAKYYQQKLAVQPDGLVETPSCFALIEAKKIGRSSFQPQQLAKEFVLVMRDSKGRQPLLWLILSSRPPVSVKGKKKLSIYEAIDLQLETILRRAENHDFKADSLLQRVNDVVCWTTWGTILDIVSEARKRFASADESTDACIQRLARSLEQAVARHS
ncbi:MAG: hypothetical protein ABSA97_14485 [Verrucomicrobiia bacterium]